MGNDMQIDRMELRQAVARWADEVAAREIARSKEIGEIITRYDEMPKIEKPKLPDGISVAWSGGGYARSPMRCAQSGLPIFDDDETVDDGETGETFLRAALGLPPRESEEEDADDDSTDLADETAPDAQWASEGATKGSAA